MSEPLDLFAAAPEPSGPYCVATLRAHGQEQRGEWLQLWAEARHPLYSAQDREAVMRLEGLDPDDFTLYDPSPINGLTDGFKRTFWYAWPKGKPSPAVTLAAK